MRSIRIIALGLIAVAAIVFALPGLVGPRTATNACAGNLIYIEELKGQRVALKGFPANREITIADFFDVDATNQFPSCPAGGTYRIGTMSEKASCSIGTPGHVIDKK